MRDRKIPKCNAALVEAVFELMFETLWLEPYNRRRQDPFYIEYDVCVRHVARMLSAVDLDSAGPEQLQAMSKAVHALAESIGRLALTGIFLPSRCKTALEVVGRIGQVVDLKVVVC